MEEDGVMMAIIPAMQSQTSRAIDVACESLLGERRRSALLRCSSIGDPCDRRLWFALRWAIEPEQHEGRVLRIFDNGHSREARLIDFLRVAGMRVSNVDPATGEQWRVVLAGGWLGGSCDGVVENVPEAPKTPHLLEIKTMKESRYRAWRKKGVAASDPRYWAQMQAYMHGLDLKRALFLVENQDTREIEIERVEYDPAAAARIEAKAMRIATMDELPPRLSDDPGWFECRFCPARALCHGDDAPLRTCRTCMAGEFTAPGALVCGRTDEILTDARQEQGCGAHLYLPSLVDGEAIDVDIDAARIVYRLRDGAQWIDGGADG